MSRGNELYMNAKWPLKATLVFNLETNKPETVQITDNTGLLILCKCTVTEEAKQLTELLNWMNDLITNHETVISEKNVHAHELAEFKKKYFELLPKYEDAMKQLYPLKVIDAEEKPKSAGQQMVEVTGTKDYTYRPQNFDKSD